MEQYKEKYSQSQISINAILADIEKGEIAIPEIQRPFVWSSSQVRDFIDSLYHGYPTGYLIIWQNPNVKLKNGEISVGKKVLIDGQQRITSLMTALCGKTILTEDYEEKIIKIAFNPLATDEEECFAVQTPAHIKSSFWISDISIVFDPLFDSYQFVSDYIAKNPNVTPQYVNTKISQLNAIKTRLIGTITLIAGLDIEEVTDIFVRINSKGTRLNEADFAMSKIAADEKFDGNMMRKTIDYFCHLAVKPEFYSTILNNDKNFMSSEYAKQLKWLKDDHADIYDPNYSDMLRVSFMHIFNRAKLGDLVNLLSGRDFVNKVYKEEIAEHSFSQLKTGIENFMNEHNFNQFVLAIKSAGFISSKLLNSQMTLDFAYSLFLLLQKDKSVPKQNIKKYVQKWFVLSTLTGRYTGSPESQMDRDLKAINEKGVSVFLEEVEKAELSEAFWNVGLVQKLETSSSNSPYLSVYLAAQIFDGDKALLSNSTKVSDLISVTGDVHHIFPKAYLRRSGITNKTLQNQIGNYALLDTVVNVLIADKAPNVYFKEALEQCKCKINDIDKVGTIVSEEDFQNNLVNNSISLNVINMDYKNYEDFLKQRRILMAEKIKKYYAKL